MRRLERDVERTSALILGLDAERLSKIARVGSCVYEMRVSKLEAGDPAIAGAATELGEALWHLDRRDEAHRYLEEAQRILEEGGPLTAEELGPLEARLERLGAC